MDWIYHFFEACCYTHPLHPALTHMPSGLVVGAVVLGFLACRYNRPDFGIAARYCLILALVFSFPSAITGFMDWQHYYGGVWIFAIKIKIVFTVLLVLSLALGLYVSRKADLCSKAFLPVYLLYFLSVTVLGYLGGGMVIGEKHGKVPSEYQGGEKIYAANCASCHPNGGNTCMPSMPLAGSSQLKDFDTFLAYNRNPKIPGPSTMCPMRMMPPISEKKVSDQQMKELYLYIVKVMHPHH